MIRKKGVMDMTETLENFTQIMENYESKKEKDTSKMNEIAAFLKMKSIASQYDEIICKYTEKNKKIRNGKTVIKGTRITPEEMLLIVKEAMDEKNNDIDAMCKYINEQYPSIDSKEQIIAGISYNINKISTLKYILGVMIKK